MLQSGHVGAAQASSFNRKYGARAPDASVRVCCWDYFSNSSPMRWTQLRMQGTHSTGSEYLERVYLSVSLHVGDHFRMGGLVVYDRQNLWEFWVHRVCKKCDVERGHWPHHHLSRMAYRRYSYEDVEQAQHLDEHVLIGYSLSSCPKISS